MRKRLKRLSAFQLDCSRPRATKMMVDARFPPCQNQGPGCLCRTGNVVAKTVLPSLTMSTDYPPTQSWSEGKGEGKFSWERDVPCCVLWVPTPSPVEESGEASHLLMLQATNCSEGLMWDSCKGLMTRTKQAPRVSMSCTGHRPLCRMCSTDASIRDIQ